MQPAVPAIVSFALVLLFYLLYEGNKFSKRFSRPLAVFFKGMATFCASLLAFYGAARSGQTADYLLAFGLLICAAADVVLDIRFVAGMGVFAVGHALFCSAYIILNPPTTINFILIIFFAVLITMGALKFKKRLGQRAVSFVLYAYVLFAMLSLGVTQRPVLALGAVFFVVSDMTLAKNILLGASRRQDYFSLGCYYLGQYLIGLSVIL